MNDYYPVALTGHRPSKLGGYDRFNPVASRILDAAAGWLEESLREHPNLVVISGLALGWDQWVADLCLELGVTFVGAAPCRGQSSRWPDNSKSEYQRICRGADEKAARSLNTGPDGSEVLARNRGVVYVLDGPYSGPDCMQQRNVWMVDHAHEVLACYDGSSGGTGNCVKYAKKQGVPVHVVGVDGSIVKSEVQSSLW